MRFACGKCFRKPVRDTIFDAKNALRRRHPSGAKTRAAQNAGLSCTKCSTRGARPIPPRGVAVAPAGNVVNIAARCALPVMWRTLTPTACCASPVVMKDRQCVFELLKFAPLTGAAAATDFARCGGHDTTTTGFSSALVEELLEAASTLVEELLEADGASASFIRALMCSALPDEFFSGTAGSFFSSASLILSLTVVLLPFKRRLPIVPCPFAVPGGAALRGQRPLCSELVPARRGRA